MMVSTRGHPKDFPEPDLSPSKQTSPRARKSKWTHTVSSLTLIWLLISLPLVAWDTGYVLLRPHSMPGGSLHKPLFVPYELYGKVDYIYGWKAYNDHNGFTAAQSIMNVIESIMYAYYLYILFAYGRRATAHGRGAPKPATAGVLREQRYVDGKMAGVAVIIALSAAIMTVSKTALYLLNEYSSGFENVGHNKLQDIILFWIIPNGSWLVLPSYMIFVVGSEILQGLAIAAGEATPSSDDTTMIKNALSKAE